MTRSTTSDNTAGYTRRQLGPRPVNPANISFSDSCFEIVGHETYWSILPAAGSAGYPMDFRTREDAEAARSGAQVVSECTKPIRARIRWS